MKRRFLLLPAAGFMQLLSFSSSRNFQQEKWTSLFNGKDLSGWDSYLGPIYDDAGHKKPGPGLNHDTYRVFTVVKEEGENVIRVSGEVSGGISTKKEFSDYHLQLMFKWGKLSWGEHKGKKKDSGLLYHSVGPYGADYGNWMRSQEFQIEQGNCGDYWGCAGALDDVPADKKSDSEYVYNPSGTFYTFADKTKVGRNCIKRGDAENAEGSWNTLDLWCHGDTAVHVVNGKVMMVLYHSRQRDNGKDHPLIKGKLQIQSEGSEVFYKQIRITPVHEIPKAYFK